MASEEVLRLLTASPTYTFGAIVTVWLAPNCSQVTPSAELYMLNTFPLLASLIQYGNAPLPNDWYELLAPVLVHRPVPGQRLVDKMDSVRTGEQGPLSRSRHRERPVRVTSTPR